MELVYACMLTVRLVSMYAANDDVVRMVDVVRFLTIMYMSCDVFDGAYMVLLGMSMGMIVFGDKIVWRLMYMHVVVLMLNWFVATGHWYVYVWEGAIHSTYLA